MTRTIIMYPSQTMKEIYENILGNEPKNRKNGY